jgi:hypothetical protein
MKLLYLVIFALCLLFPHLLDIYIKLMDLLTTTTMSKNNGTQLSLGEGDVRQLPRSPGHEPYDDGYGSNHGS